MIKRIIATVFGIGSKPAVSTGLKKLVGSKRLAEVRARCEDKRRLLSVIADEMGVPEEQLAFAVAAKIGLPFWANVKPIDLSICADITDIEHLRRVGAIPIVSEGSISAVACVDPRLIAEQGSPLAKYQPYLSLWSNISESLATSEQRHTEQQRAKLDQERWEVLFSVLATLVEEVETYNATAEEARTVIDLSAKPITYRFRTTDRRQGSGQINQQLLNDLTELSTSHETLCLRLPNSKQTRIVMIQPDKLDNPTLVTMRWRLKLEIPSTPTAEQRLSQPGSATRVDPEPSSPSPPLNGFTKPKERVRQTTWDDKLFTTAPRVNTPAHILVIEDNDTFANVLKRFFGRLDMKVTAFTNAREALDVLRQAKLLPDVLICDVFMPGTDGFTVVKELKASKQFCDLPVIMLTSDTSTDTEVELVRSGADVFLAKHQDPRVLCAHVQRLLDQRRKRQAA